MEIIFDRFCHGKCKSPSLRAKRGNPAAFDKPRLVLDCFVVSLLAMTGFRVSAQLY